MSNLIFIFLPHKKNRTKLQHCILNKYNGNLARYLVTHSNIRNISDLSYKTLVQQQPDLLEVLLLLLLNLLPLVNTL